MDPKIINHFKKVDPILYKALQQIHKALGPFEKYEKRGSEDYFLHLTSEIVGQQLSGKVADVIFNRFLNLFPKQKVTPKLVLKIEDQKLRDTGMSWNKVKFIRDLASKVENKEVDLNHLNSLPDFEVVDELTKIKGIGPWTAEMFLMFTLNREDIFSHGDLGLKNGLKKLYNLENPTKAEIEIICNKWSPHKSAACRILWKSLELKD